MQLSSVFSNAKDIIIIVGIGLALFFGYKAFFGNDSITNLLKQNDIRMEERMKYYELQDKQHKERLEKSDKRIQELLGALESSRQHIGTNVRESYHPDMKRYPGEDNKEMLQSADDLLDQYGLPTD